jgi:hypothetical protein
MRRRLFHYLPEREQTLVRDFFSAFSAAEYELKVHGFIRRGSEDAQADWDAYGRSIRQRFRVTRPARLAKAWRTLISNPPRKQVVQNGRLGWKATERPPRISDAEWGLLLVRRVRNNLFHGAKFILGPGDQFIRDRDLVEAAQVILEAALDLMPRNRYAA